jgi:glycerol-1-phosphate dehydrogenase [NAD(P)+]
MTTIAQYLGKATDCPACGHSHRVGVRAVQVSPTAIQELPELTARLGLDPRPIVVHDARTRAAAGVEVLQAFASRGTPCTEVLVPDPADGNPICDDITRDALRPRIPEHGLLVAVGSGVVTDLVKWIATDADRPFVAVPTAASMNGYTSSNIAPTIRRVKSLLPGKEAVALATTPQVLQRAPAAMTAAGLGDVLAKPVSTADWLLNRVLFGDYYCPVCADLIRDIEPVYMTAPEQIGSGSPAGIQALFEAIVLTGISMTMAGTSSPASGGEHLIGHTLDMMAMRDGCRHDLHGRQVGVATIFCAALYDAILARVPHTFRAGTTRTDPAFWQELAPAVEAKHVLKRQRQEQAAEALRHTVRWDDLCATLRTHYRPPEVIKDVLRRAGAAHRLADIGVPRERFLAAALHAHEVRERYTVLELARTVGVLPELAEDLVDRWLLA